MYNQDFTVVHFVEVEKGEGKKPTYMTGVADYMDTSQK